MKKTRFTLKATVLAILMTLPLIFFGQENSEDAKAKPQTKFNQYWYAALNGGIAQFWGMFRIKILLKNYPMINFQAD